MKIKKGDTVKIISGKDNGKEGKVLQVIPAKKLVLVEGVNIVKKHQKPDNNQAGGIVEKEMPINISNLSYYDSALKKGVKLGYKFNQKREKFRIIRYSGKEV